MGIRPMTPAAFCTVRHSHDPGHLPDRQTHVWDGGGIGGSRAPGAFTFQHLLRPGNAHVHAPDVQCSRGDLCAGQAADGFTRHQAHRQPISGISARLAYGRTGRTRHRRMISSYQVEARLAPDGEPGSIAIVGHPSRPLRLTWPGLRLSYSRLRPCSATTRPSFSVLAANLLRSWPDALSKDQEIRISTCFPGALFCELGQGSDRHLPAMESLDDCLYQASQQGLRGVLDPSTRLEHRHPDAAHPAESLCTHASRPGP